MEFLIDPYISFFQKGYNQISRQQCRDIWFIGVSICFGSVYTDIFSLVNSLHLMLIRSEQLGLMLIFKFSGWNTIPGVSCLGKFRIAEIPGIREIKYHGQYPGRRCCAGPVQKVKPP